MSNIISFLPTKLAKPIQRSMESVREDLDQSQRTEDYVRSYEYLSFDPRFVTLNPCERILGIGLGQLVANPQRLVIMGSHLLAKITLVPSEINSWLFNTCGYSNRDIVVNGVEEFKELTDPLIDLIHSDKYQVTVRIYSDFHFDRLYKPQPHRRIALHIGEKVLRGEVPQADYWKALSKIPPRTDPPPGGSSPSPCAIITPFRRAA